MKKLNVMKRTLAGVLAVLTVAAFVPANVGTGGLFGGSQIKAAASYALPDGKTWTQVSSADELRQVFTDGGYAQLAEDISLSEDLVVGSGKTVALDLNGYNLNLTFAEEKRIIVGNNDKGAPVEDAAELTLTNSQNYGGSVNTAQCNVCNYSTMTIDQGVSLIAKKAGFTIFYKKYSTLNVYGTVCNRAHEGIAISGNGNPEYNASNAANVCSVHAKLNIYEGATVESEDNEAIYHPHNGTMNMYGGVVKGKSGIIARAGEINIMGGEVIATGAPAEIGTIANGADATGDAIVVQAYTDAYQGNPQINVSAGSVHTVNPATNGIALYKVNKETDSDAPIATVSDMADVQDINAVDGGNVEISGGSVGTVYAMADTALTVTGGEVAAVYVADPDSATVNITEGTVADVCDNSFFISEGGTFAAKVNGLRLYDGEELDYSDFEIVGLTSDAREMLDTSGPVASFPGGDDGTTCGNHKVTLTLDDDSIADIPVRIVMDAIVVKPESMTAVFGEEIPEISYTITGTLDEIPESVGNIIAVVAEPDDYTSGRLNAGEYSYKLNVDDDFDYAVELDTTGDPVFTVTQKNIDDASVVVTLVQDEFEFTNSTHTVVIDSAKDGEYDLVEGRDYTLGGDKSKYYPGSFHLQVRAVADGNYSGMVKVPWSVSSEAASFELVNNGTKTYNGDPITDTFTVSTGSVPANSAKITYQYFKAKETENGFEKNGAALSGAPSDAGLYIVEATITAKNFATQFITTVIEVEPKPVTISATGLSADSYAFGDPVPTVTGDFTYDGILDDEKDGFEMATSVEWALDEASLAIGAPLKYVGTVDTADEFANNYAFTAEYESEFTAEGKSIAAESVEVTYSTASLLVDDSVTCEIEVKDTETKKTLTEGVDYEVVGATADAQGEYEITINGKGMYASSRKLAWSVVDADNIQTTCDPFISDAEANKLRLPVKSELLCEDISPIAATGVIIFRGKVQPAAADMTIEGAAANANIYKFTKGGKTINIDVKDTEDSAYYATFTQLENGLVKYDKVEHTSMTILKAKFMAVSGKASLNESDYGKVRIVATSTGEYGEIVAKTGIIVCRSNEQPASMTFDDVSAANGIYKYQKNGDKMTLDVKDVGTAMFYTCFTEYTDGAVKYSEIKKTSLDTVKAEKMGLETEVKVYDPTSEKVRIVAKSVGEFSDVVVETGIIVCRSDEDPGEMTLETAAADANIYKFGKASDVMNLDVRDNGKTMYYVAFAKYTDGSVKYSPKATTSFAEAAGLLS
ncbi:MAG: hypothetical protein K5695_18250 [Oscillospiraceae bacterium]|nr:hypothetical protein [Oscillospiraceae bacterium]